MPITARATVSDWAECTSSSIYGPPGYKEPALGLLLLSGNVDAYAVQFYLCHASFFDTQAQNR